MKLNLGQADRIIRVIVAVVIAVLFFTKVISGTLGIVLLIVGGVLLLTAAVGLCPLYLALGLSTKAKAK